MSYSVVMHIWPGKRVVYGEELRNSHGSAPVVWDALCQHHFGARPFGYDSYLDRLIDRAEAGQLPPHHRAILRMTYDLGYVARGDYQRAADDIALFLSDFPPRAGYANHWPRLAEIFAAAPRSPALAIYQTSVSENPWDRSNRDRWRKMIDVYSGSARGEGA